MKTPLPGPGANPAPKTTPVLVLPSTARRDTLIGVIAGILALAGLIFAFSHLSAPVPGNRLTGVVVGRTFKSLPERQIDFSGRRIQATRELDGEYSLQVRVAAENRTYEVPVEKSIYRAKQDGESLTFIRPPSEQK